MSRVGTFANANVSLTPQIFYILLALASQDRHGYDIMKQVEVDSLRKIKLGPGTLYGALKRMLEEKLIMEIASDSVRRKYYRLTSKGKAIFTSELTRYQATIKLAEDRKLLHLAYV